MVVGWRYGLVQVCPATNQRETTPMAVRTPKGAKKPASSETDESTEALWSRLRALTDEIDPIDEQLAEMKAARDPLDAERRVIIFMLHKRRGATLASISEVTGLTVQAMSQQAMKGARQATG